MYMSGVRINGAMEQKHHLLNIVLMMLMEKLIIKLFWRKLMMSLILVSERIGACQHSMSLKNYKTIVHGFG